MHAARASGRPGTAGVRACGATNLRTALLAKGASSRDSRGTGKSYSAVELASKDPVPKLYGLSPLIGACGRLFRSDDPTAGRRTGSLPRDHYHGITTTGSQPRRNEDAKNTKVFGDVFGRITPRRTRRHEGHAKNAKNSNTIFELFREADRRGGFGWSLHLSYDAFRWVNANALKQHVFLFFVPSWL